MFASLSNCLLRKYMMAENANKIMDSDKKISDKAVYLSSLKGINSNIAEIIIKITPIMKIILDKAFVFTLYSKIDFLFSFCFKIFISSRS